MHNSVLVPVGPVYPLTSSRRNLAVWAPEAADEGIEPLAGYTTQHPRRSPEAGDLILRRLSVGEAQWHRIVVLADHSHGGLVAYRKATLGAIDLDALNLPLDPVLAPPWEAVWRRMARMGWREGKSPPSELHELRGQIGHLPPYALFRHCTPSEVLQLWWTSITCLRVADAFWADRPYAVAAKIKSSVWRWDMRGSASDGAGWTHFVRAYQELGRFDFGDGFTVQLDMATKHNERGFAAYTPDLYLDGSFGYVVSWKGRHVFTIGFSLVGSGVIIQQVQLAQARGNRWLYKLNGMPGLMARVLDRFAATFAGQLYLVEGAAAVAAIVRNYSDEPPAAEVLDRIRRYYDAPIPGWSRGGRRPFGRSEFREMLPTAGEPRLRLRQGSRRLDRKTA